MKIITFCSFKGGTGKTTLSMNVACYLSEMKNKKVLLIDMDPQANLTAYAGVRNADSLGSFELLRSGNKASSLIRKTSLKNLDIVPSCLNSEVFREMGREKFFFSGNLKTSLSDLNYDICIIDTPPSLGFIVREAFLASDELLICLSPEPFSVIGLQKMKGFLESCPELNLGILGVVVSFWDSRNSTNSLYISNIESTLPSKTPFYLVRKDVVFSRSVLMESPVFLSYPNSRASSDIKTLSEAIFSHIFINDLENIR
ncbi:ParA family protein [Chlamydiifrater volucris]|uniref:ParA family protein n=1 Tax=Chlamydiifrater volucris TaxID=2681470 RepID=UPI0032B12AC0